MLLAPSLARLSFPRIAAATTLLLVGATPALPAQDVIPQTSGFGGYGAFALAAAAGRTSFFASGAPLLGPITRPLITSIFEAPEPLRAPALLVGGEVNYTFASTRTQLFIEQSLEDAFQLDVLVRLGVRQELPDKSILTVAGIVTPLPQKLWIDPYVEGVAREFEKANQPGFRIRWRRILGTRLELTFTDRYYLFDAEQSGQWLVGQGRLDPDDVDLLDRNGDNKSFTAAYRIQAASHLFEPSVAWVRDDRDGAAMANDGFGARLNYRYVNPRIVVDANIEYVRRQHDALHPVYGERVSRDRIGGAIVAAVPIEVFGSTKWNLWAMTEYIHEQSNVDFFISRLVGLTLGVGWRGLRQ